MSSQDKADKSLPELRRLRKSGERLRDLFENMMDGLVVHRLIEGENGKPVDYILERMNRPAEGLLSCQNAFSKRSSTGA